MDLILTPKDYRSQALYFYYAGHKKWKYLRPVLGLIALIMGAWMLSVETKNFFIAYGGFMLGFGIYYLLVPFLVIMTKKYKEEAVSIHFNEQSLILRDRLSESVLSFLEYPLLENSRYFYINISKTSRLFFPKDKLSEEEKGVFKKHLVSVNR